MQASLPICIAMLYRKCILSELLKECVKKKILRMGVS
jgi:hypothetical protein